MCLGISERNIYWPLKERYSSLIRKYNGYVYVTESLVFFWVFQPFPCLSSLDPLLTSRVTVSLWNWRFSVLQVTHLHFCTLHTICLCLSSVRNSPFTNPGQLKKLFPDFCMLEWTIPMLWGIHPCRTTSPPRLLYPLGLSLSISLNKVKSVLLKVQGCNSAVPLNPFRFLNSTIKWWFALGDAGLLQSQ